MAPINGTSRGCRLRPVSVCHHKMGQVKNTGAAMTQDFRSVRRRTHDGCWGEKSRQRSILVILEPSSVTFAINPFWSSTNASTGFLSVIVLTEP